MRVLIAGLGIQGGKRLAVAGDEVVATVDPVLAKARYKSVSEVPLEAYDAALLCIPDAAKLELIEYLIVHGKHVMVEKPLLAEDGGRLRNLLSLSAGRNLACYTAYNHRFEPHIAKLKAHLDSGVLGRVYHARFFYGNGTARDVRNSVWRDQGMGVLADLGSHLLDMALFLFGPNLGAFQAWSCHRFENRTCDYATFGSPGPPAIEMTTSLMSWRNTFSLDVHGELGSAHIQGLLKWGPSTLTLRKRVLPSGRPDEEQCTLSGADPTWSIEYQYFKGLCRNGGTNLQNDVRISAILKDLMRQTSGAPS